jgi:tight adherence protein B
MPDPVVLASFVLALGLVLLVAIAAGGFASDGEKRLRRRLRRIENPRQPSARPNADLALRRNMRSSSIPALDRLITRFMPRPTELRRRLGRTGKKLTLGEYVLGCGVAGVSVAVIARIAFTTSPLLSCLLGIGAGLALPHMVVETLIKRRVKAFTAQFPEAIDLIVRGLKSGLPVAASMQTVAEEMQDPIAAEFRTITDQLRVGLTLDDALRNAADRIATAEFRFFVISLAVQRETGGNLAETLENLTDILRKRRQMKLKIKAMSSEAKASAMILGSLPFLLFGILMLINAGYVTQLFYDHRGNIMLGFGLVSLLLGILVMAKMVRFEI